MKHETLVFVMGSSMISTGYTAIARTKARIDIFELSKKEEGMFNIPVWRNGDEDLPKEKEY
jgi:hypothetical protein